MDLSEKERAEIVKLYYCNNSVRQVRDFWAGMYPNRPIPSKTFINKLIRNFEETGKLTPKARGGIRRNGDANEINVLALLNENSNLSAAQISQTAGTSKANVIRILHKHKFKSYKIQRHQELLPRDAEVRNTFADQMFNLANDNPDFLKNICFSDETTYTLHGEPNRQNTRIWAKENPREFLQTRTQWPQKVNVWIGILGHHVIGPFYIDGNLNGEKYLQLLQQQVYPEIQRVRGGRTDDVWFQQDGCPSHCTRGVIDFLNAHFPNRWIGRGGFIRWPPRSPDLSPNDYHLWGHIKSKIYGNHRFNDLNELKEAINDVCRSFTRKHLANVRKEFYNRLNYCLVQNGRHFEHLLK